MKNTLTGTKYLPKRATHVDDLTVDWYDNGVQRVVELDKEVLSKGSWATVMFKFLEWDDKNKCYRPNPKVGFRRYRKNRGEYRYQSKYNVSSPKQALEVVRNLERMFEKEFAELRAEEEYKKEFGENNNRAYA
jgi:hypothetical protein